MPREPLRALSTSAIREELWQRDHGGTWRGTVHFFGYVPAELRDEIRRRERDWPRDADRRKIKPIRASEGAFARARDMIVRLETQCFVVGYGREEENDEPGIVACVWCLCLHSRRDEPCCYTCRLRENSMRLLEEGRDTSRTDARVQVLAAYQRPEEPGEEVDPDDYVVVALPALHGAAVV